MTHHPLPATPPRIRRPPTPHMVATMTPALDTQSVLDLVDKRISALETFALQHRLSNGTLSHIQNKVIDYDPGELFLRTVRNTLAKLTGITEKMSRMKTGDRDIKQKSVAISHEQMKYVYLSFNRGKKNHPTGFAYAKNS